MRRRGQRMLMVVCLLGAGYFAVAAGGIHAKAWLAQQLIAHAWARTLAEGQPVKPWPWADTWPVATLRWGGEARPLYVLSAAGGEALAFGPSLVAGSYPPGSQGTVVIGGHRDTHFRAMRQMAVGDRLRLADAAGRESVYEVVSALVVDTRSSALQARVADEALVLVTCYPFDAVRPGGPLRYVVTARRA